MTGSDPNGVSVTCNEIIHIDDLTIYSFPKKKKRTSAKLEHKPGVCAVTRRKEHFNPVTEVKLCVSALTSDKQKPKLYQTRLSNQTHL